MLGLTFLEAPMSYVSASTHRVLPLSAGTISISDHPTGLSTQRLGTPDLIDTFPSLYSAELRSGGAPSQVGTTRTFSAFSPGALWRSAWTRIRHWRNTLLFLHVALRRPPGRPTKYRATNQSVFTQFPHDPICDYHYIPGISHTIAGLMCD